MRLKMVGGGGGSGSEGLTAKAADVLKGKTAITADSDDEAITGTLPDNGQYQYGDVFGHGTGDGEEYYSYSIPAGAYSGTPEIRIPADTLRSDLGITADLIASGKKAAGISGTYGSDGNLAAKDLRAGKVGYGGSGRVAGSAVDYGRVQKTIGAGESYTINEGIYSAGKITAKTLSSQTSGTAAAANILSGKTAYVNGSKVTGTMADRGKYQYTTSVGSGTGDGDYEGVEYYALNRIPEGAYFSNGSDWAPEIRIPKEDLASGIGLTAEKLVKGQTVCGVTGTKKWSVKMISAFAACSESGDGTDGTDSDGVQESFTMPAAGTVYFGGGSIRSNRKTGIICGIYKNDSPVDERNITNNTTENYAYRGTMFNKSFSVAKGDVIKVKAKAITSGTNMACIQAVIIYFA